MTGSGRILRMSYIVAGVGGIGFFAMSVLLLGVWPGRVLEDQTRRMSPDHPLDLTTSQKRGRVIYGREGCAYCHTQQVRFLVRDVSRFGAPTLAWETRFDYPQLWGTRRIGPDLAREGSIRSLDWQLSHLYAPRALVPDSIMPGFPWLFDGAPDRPAQEGRDLLAYLETLGRARELAGPEGEAKARLACNCEEDMQRLEFGPPTNLNANAAKARRQGDHPTLASVTDSKQGENVYRHNCSGCHGTRGEGDGPGAIGLHPRPANLAEHEYTRDRLGVALWNGVAGTAMPAWRDTPERDLSALAGFVRGFHQPSPEPILPAQVTELGSLVYGAHCANCHGETAEPGMDRCHLEELHTSRPNEFCKRASQLCPEPSCRAQRRRRDRDGSVER